MKIVIRISLQICFMLLLSIGSVNAQVTKPYNNLIITEARMSETPQNYVEFTNMGSETINLSEFEFGHIGPWDHPWASVANNHFMLPNKLLAPGKSFVIAVGSDFGPENWKKDPLNYFERVTKPEFYQLADMILHCQEINSNRNDSITPNWQTMNGWGGRECWFLRHHYTIDGVKDSVIIDQVGGAFDSPSGQNYDKAYDVAGVQNATNTCVLIRKASVKTGRVDFNSGRGFDLADSEWIPVPALSFGDAADQGWRAVFWTTGNQVDAMLDANTLVSKTGKVSVDLANATITVPWGVRRNDSIMYQFVRKPGLAWKYDYAPTTEDLAYISARTGDKLTLYVCGNQAVIKEFTIITQAPTTSDNIVIPKNEYDYALMSYGQFLKPYSGIRVSDGVVGMDTIRFVPFATRVDTLFKYLEKAPMASWQISYIDGVVRPDLISGDKLQVTSEDGKLKEYYLKLQKYTPSADAYLSSITWPDMPAWFKGDKAKSYGWAGDTIPGFTYTKNNYVVKIPLEYDGIPALVFSKRQLNSKVTVTRAKTLTGLPEGRTVTFTVTAENDTTVNVYTVRFEKEKDPANIQHWKAEPFFSQIVFQEWWNNPWIEVVNPGTEILDLSHYMIFCNYTGRAIAFSAFNAVGTLYSDGPWRKYVPGKKWQDEASWAVQPRILEPDLAVNAIVYPGDVFVMTQHSGGNAFDIYGKEADVNFATGKNPWGYSMPWNNAIHDWMGTTYYMYKILNDSVINGLKPAIDVTDFELVDVFGMEDGSNITVGGKTINQLTAYTRKPGIFKGNTEVKGSLGTTWDDSEWTMKDDAYFNALQFSWPLNIMSICDGIGSHIMDEVTITKSTVTSKVYKVSPGYSQKETIKGLTTGTTVSGFYSNIMKANALQTLKVKSATNGAELTEADAISHGDTLIVLSADSINTSKYILDVTTTGLSSDAVLTSTDYDIIITGSIGRIKKIPPGTLLKEVLAGLTVPAGATLTIVDATDANVPLTKLNYSNAYVDVFATAQIYFEVIAENGTTQILYNLNPYSSSTDAFVTSDVYSVDQQCALIQFIPVGTSVQSLLSNVYPCVKTTVKVIDKAGFIRETGAVYQDDKLVVTAADGKTTKVYYLSILNNKVNTYLAYVNSDVYQVDQVKHIITGPKINTTNSEFISNLYPSFGATLEVLDLDANGALSLNDKLLVTSADGSTNTTYEINDPSILLFSIIGSAFYKNDGVTLANWDYDIDLTYMGTSANGSNYRISKQELLQGGEFKIRKDHHWNESYGYQEVFILGDQTNFVDALPAPNIKVLAQKIYEITFIVDWANNVYTLVLNNLFVTTTDINSITSSSAVSGGEVISEGSSPVTVRGVCWSIMPNPTVDLTTKTTDGSGLGAFTSNITGLNDMTTYHVRAYATNSEVTFYGEDLSFITIPNFEPGLRQDSLALVALYNQCDGPNWTNRTNWLVGPVKNWFGITVQEGHVTEIKLIGNGLKGTLPSELEVLTSLTYLTFYGNQLTGALPAWIGNFTKLWILELSYNNMVGPIPQDWENLKNLMSLLLHGNAINTALPAWLIKLNKLDVLGLQGCGFTGVIPSEWTAFTSLGAFVIDGNNLTGSLPAWLANNQGIYHINLEANNLTGTLPESWSSLVNLRGINLGRNQLTGSVPNSWSELVNLEELNLMSNQISGLPDFVLMTKLNNLTVQNNLLDFGDIKPNIGGPNNEFSYSPQKNFGQVEIYSKQAGEALTLTATVGGTGNLYQWYKDGNLLTGKTSNTLIFNALVIADSGSYGCKVTNPSVPNLLLESESMSVTVQDKTSPVAVTMIPMNQSIVPKNLSQLVVVFSEGIKAGTGCVKLFNQSDVLVETICSGNWVISGNTLIVPIKPLLANATYYILIDSNAILDLAGNLFSGFSNKNQFTFRTEAESVITHFTPVWTGNGFDHMNINIYSAKIDGVELESGDEVGIFDGTICVGVGTLTGTITSLNTLDIAVSKNDGSGNGYTSGNSISYKLYDKSKDLEMTNVSAVYSNTDPSWSTDGKFTISATAFAELAGLTKVNQDITLNTGWNIISANVIPANLNLKDLFQSLIDAGKLKKVMDESGKTIENFGAFGGWKNNIGNLNSAKGYKVNVTAASTLSLEGTPVTLPFDLALATGWNIISYPSGTAQDAKALFQSLIDGGKLKKVMDEAGKTIENFGAFGGWKNNIGNFLSGKGYKVNVLENCTLTIPANGTKSAVVVPEVLASTHFTKVYTGNGTDHTTINLVNLQASGLQAGDEIGVFDGKLCVGSATIGLEQLMDGSISIPASANDELAETMNGFTSGHPIELKLYRGTQTHKLNLAKLTGNELFEKNGSLFVQANANDLTGIQITDNSDMFKCYPNPFTREITIEVQNPTQNEITVEIYNIAGQRIKNLFKGTSSGHLVLKWNGTNDSGQQVAPGVYLCKVNGQSKQVIFEGEKGMRK